MTGFPLDANGARIHLGDHVQARVPPCNGSNHAEGGGCCHLLSGVVRVEEIMHFAVRVSQLRRDHIPIHLPENLIVCNDRELSPFIRERAKPPPANPATYKTKKVRRR